MDKRIRVFIIDDQEIFRIGLRVSLRECRDICIAGEADRGAAGLELIARGKPDVAIVDIWLPGMDGVQVAEQIMQISPATRIMLISGFFDDEAIARSLQLGVDGIITKTDSPRQFASFIRRVHDGVFCFSPSLADNPYVHMPALSG